MGRLFIVGCSGHGKVVADIAICTGKYKELYFLDDNPEVKECMGIPVVGNSQFLDFESGDEVVVAIGNSKIRERVQEYYQKSGITIATLIHPQAVVGTKVEIGEGSVVMAGTVINPETCIGKGVILNTGATVDHDNEIGDYSHVSVGAHLAGTVKVGRHTWIGAGAIVKNNIDITDEVMVGAGGVVVKNITESGVYIGVPVRKKDEDTDTCK